MSLKEIASRMNIESWKTFSTLNKCFYGCKFKEPLYIGDKDKTLNPKYVAHIYQTHGVHPLILIDMIADKIYKKEEDKEKMRKLYSFFEKL